MIGNDKLRLIMRSNSHTSIQKHSNQMKIVLKHDHQIKLYTEELDFQHILTFIHTEFSLTKESLTMTFQDPDGDDITILNNEDFNIMQTILEGREYVRINVQGIKKEPLLNNSKLITISLPQTEENQQLIPKNSNHPEQKLPAESANKKEESGPKQPEKAVSIEAESGSKCQWSDKKQKVCKIKSFMNEMVANLVDERIKALLPCLKEQILKAPEKVQAAAEGKLIHEGVQCKGCSVKPIAGTRYQCPKCPSFSLCEACQQKIDHEHNLLKIKKIQPKEKNEATCMREYFGSFFRGCPRRQGEQSGLECGRWGSPHHMMRKLMGLSFIFGNEPESYRKFVEQNKFLWPRQTYLKYAQVVGMPEAQFREKFTALRCHKLSQNFGKPAETYKSFVEQNYDLGLKDLMKLLFQKGIEKREEGCNWKGRCFSFKGYHGESHCEQKKQQKCKSGKVFSLEKPQPKAENEVYISESMLEQPKPLDSPQVNRAKGLLFTSIQQLFSEAEKKTIYKFVDQHYKNQNYDEVMDLWIKKNIEK